MKHAVLIIAHKNKDQLKRLVKAVSDENTDVFIHPDANWLLTGEDMKEIEQSGKNNVIILKRRIHGVFHDWSLTKIQLLLIEKALKEEKKRRYRYSYFMLLSGQDYPIKSRAYFEEFLSAQYPKPLIDVEGYQGPSWEQYLFPKDERYGNHLDKINNKYKGLKRKILTVLTVIYHKMHFWYKGDTVLEKLSNKNIKIFSGSQWWILPHDIVEYVLKYSKKRNYAAVLLKSGTTPEEYYFQTVINNSPWKETMSSDDDIYDKGDNEQPCMTYANFVTSTKKFVGHPHIITMEDFDRIMAKKALFARKFDLAVDSAVMDEIDKITGR